ncbi:MAG: bacteriohemerythrin [Thermodesulfobacteriota bacterium]
MRDALKKIEVVDGVFWIEVPDADLRILCGCPADSVKHLMKRGLIVPAERRGVRCETGPNAILLSDVLVQNGAFSNLAEFPVLQMLYRQGLILPNHPNNTGGRPLLLGSEQQVRAQMRYIHRGNYGLVSEEEMRQAGLSPARARLEMRQKLRFAFGGIRPTEDLLDTLVIGQDEAEVRGGVTVRRLESNVFEFAYRDERTRVDLNLAPRARYASPYPLGFNDLGREYFAVIHSGDGDGWDVNRPTMSSILMFQGRTYLIDAGPNILHSLTALGIGVNEIEGVFHTHAHDDHFCGLTTLMQAGRRLKHFAAPHVQACVAKKWAALVSQPEDEFARYFDLRPLREGRYNDVDGLEVMPVFSPHPVETTIMFFRARSGEGCRTYAHLADIAGCEVLESFLTEDADAPGLSREAFERVWKDYLRKADVKKLDIGGGLIHGRAEDFRDDPSAKIILSHTAEPLTDSQKEIGSGAPFGMKDVLIPGAQDFVRLLAHHYLEDALPGMERHMARLLMNQEVRTYNPESILLKRGQRNRDVLLIITGVAEMLDPEQGVQNRVTAGYLVGDVSALSGAPSRATYRAASHVRVLRLPGGLFRDVLRATGLDREYGELSERREFLQQTWLFGESIPAVIQSRMARDMRLVDLAPGEGVSQAGEPGLLLVESGRVDVRLRDHVVESLGPGQFYGEGRVLFDIPCIYQARARERTRAYCIPTGILQDVPVVRWKLFETYRRRMESVFDPRMTELGLFSWHDEYALGVADIDREHRRLFDAAGKVHELLLRSAGRAAVEEGVDGLIQVAANHFRTEEALLERAGYPGLDRHRSLHRELLREIQDKKERIRDNNLNMSIEFLAFAKAWILDHILTADREFAPFLLDRREPA